MQASVTFEDNVLIVGNEGYLKKDDAVKVFRLAEETRDLLESSAVASVHVLFDLRNVHHIEPHVREALIAFLTTISKHVSRLASVTRSKDVREIEKTLYTLGGIGDVGTFNTMQKGLNWVRA